MKNKRKYAIIAYLFFQAGKVRKIPENYWKQIRKTKNPLGSKPPSQLRFTVVLVLHPTMHFSPESSIQSNSGMQVVYTHANNELEMVYVEILGAVINANLVFFVKIHSSVWDMQVHNGCAVSPAGLKLSFFLKKRICCKSGHLSEK